MQEAARCTEKLKRAPAFLAQRRGPQTFRGHPAAISIELRNQSEPSGQMVIPQAAGGFLEVGLEMKNGLPVLVMPATRELDEVAHQLLAFPRDHLRNHRSEEHTSELQSRLHLVCRLLLEKKKKKKHTIVQPPNNTESID